jgi:Vitamin K-dependent gamma-carboxylase
VTTTDVRPRPVTTNRADRWLLAPAPPTRLAVLRVLIAGYCVFHLIVTAPSLLQIADLPAEQFSPVGVLAWLSHPLSHSLVAAGLLVAVAAGIAVALGWRWRVSAPAFAVLFLVLSTYRVSWGHVSHADHLPAVHLVILVLAPAADAWSLDARRRRRPIPGPHPRYGWPVRILALATVVSYVVAGIAKLRYAGTGWLDGDVLRNQLAADALQKTLLGASHSPIGGWLAAHPAVLPAAAVAALAVELGAPVALLGRRWRNLWVVAAWLFHVSIAAVMAIAFPYPLYGVAFAPFFDVERGVERIRHAVAARSAGTRA